MSARSGARGFLLDPESFLSPPPPPFPTTTSDNSPASTQGYRTQRSPFRRLPRPPAAGGMPVSGRRPSGMRLHRHTSSDSGRYGSPADGQPASKRRRKDAPFKGGQWEMALLELDVKVVEGGTYGVGPVYEVSNVLRDNRDTYMSKSSRCVLNFEHTGRKCFTLQQLVFEAKADTYHQTQIQEGAVFVSMDISDFDDAVDYEFRDEDDEAEEDEEEEEAREEEEQREDEEVAKTLLEPMDAQGSISYFEEHSQLQQIEGTTKSIEPQARIYISKKASKCVINFEPALSGRYIQTRFYGRQGEPIEIRHIAAYGYTGSRIFPSLVPR